ncbi:adenylate/guanylate cyclase domain-containing protein [Bradyrhizobium centrosematis]|uniref:adenylate/guanylate cyclase domain-containing protein n=1 Tax=Bradyrhizobium centrosematis TaxID=1300039 RepID=UPI002169D1DA|nr:adenylate/guanylate cyclase domain-containing protein [Bradyrhizobium centrosematis]MCS3763152.1 class 3 adenylate cyclase/pimeloyl-ACP methyl ester carboxylesterase [Bradyrhizobium centrosematis]MCS3775819.1 class 3 adenylate cyclase/pimeloyl-ACP methyl ester carboxylesterase [Bradyrhizobium centrosematis]
MNVAYQVMGNGSVDLIIVPGLIAHAEFLHELPGYTDFLRRLSSFARVVTFDKSGQGLSDRYAGKPSFEQRVDDIQAVMEAIDSKRAVILGCSEGGPISMAFAASFPERVSHLVLFGSYARLTCAPGYPFRPSVDKLMNLVDCHWAASWGTGVTIGGFLPSHASDPDVARQYAKLERLAYSPGSLKMAARYNIEIDVRTVLPAVRVPTLVLHRQDGVIEIENGEYLASHIPGAKFIAYTDCNDHLIFPGDRQRVCGDIEEFVTGHREATALDRVLATVLFSDIVDSTRRAVTMGDQAWRRVLDEHDNAARRIILQHRGNLIKTTGDGILATFDGPGRAIRCALALEAATRRLGVPVRAGLHTGEIELRTGDIGGIAVHAAARVMAQAKPAEVLVSRVVTDLVAGAGLKFSDRGTHELKGLPGRWDLFAASA